MELTGQLSHSSSLPFRLHNIQQHECVKAAIFQIPQPRDRMGFHPLFNSLTHLTHFTDENCSKTLYPRVFHRPRNRIRMDPPTPPLRIQGLVLASPCALLVFCPQKQWCPRPSFPILINPRCWETHLCHYVRMPCLAQPCNKMQVSKQLFLKDTVAKQGSLQVPPGAPPSG